MTSIDGPAIEAKSVSPSKFRGRESRERFSVTKDKFTSKNPRHKSHTGLYIPPKGENIQPPIPYRNSMLACVSLETMRNIGHFENLPRGIDLGEPNFRRKQQDLTGEPSEISILNLPNNYIFPIRKNTDDFNWGSYDRESSEVRTS
jgi:hypothetical protein